MQFAERLKSLRQHKGFSQQKLAAVIGFSQQSIGKWELGSASPSPEIITILADVFDVSADYLLGRSDDPTPLDKEKDPLEGVKFALWGHGDITEDMLDDVRRFARMIELEKKEKKEKENGKPN